MHWLLLGLGIAIEILATAALKLSDGLAIAEMADKPLPPEETAAGGSNRGKGKGRKKDG